VLVVGGTNKTTALLANAELYLPAAGAWTATGSLKEKHAFHTATLLPNGQVLVAGGYAAFFQYPFPGFYFSTSGAELYDSISGTWTSTNSMLNSHVGHVAVLLPSGNVLVGGDGPYGVELFDTSRGTWSAAPPLITFRRFCAFTLLASGGVLASGGLGISSYLGTSELYGLPNALSPLIRPDGTPCFCFTNIHGLSFAIMTSTNLSLPFANWQMIGGVVEIAPGSFRFTDPRGTGGGQQFYRAVSQ
jgi:hypothetical protein